MASVYDIDVPVEALATKRRRQVRAPIMRNHTQNVGRIGKAWMESESHEYRAEMRALNTLRPRSYAECLARDIGGDTPCFHMRCVWHLALDVNPDTGSIKLRNPGHDGLPDMSGPTCALRMVDANPDGMTLEEIATVTTITRERVRQIVDGAFATMHADADAVLMSLAPDRGINRPDLCGVKRCAPPEDSVPRDEVSGPVEASDAMFRHDAAEDYTLRCWGEGAW